MKMTLKKARAAQRLTGSIGETSRGFLDAVDGLDPRQTTSAYEAGWLEGYEQRQIARRMNVSVEALDAMAWRWTCQCGETENGNTDDHCTACGIPITCKQAGGHSWTDGDTVCNRGTCHVPS